MREEKEIEGKGVGEEGRGHRWSKRLCVVSPCV